MTIFEGIILANIFAALWSAYQIGKIRTEIDTIYEGLELCMAAAALANRKD